jgi:hypothetical protein
MTKNGGGETKRGAAAYRSGVLRTALFPELFCQVHEIARDEIE